MISPSMILVAVISIVLAIGICLLVFARGRGFFCRLSIIVAGLHLFAVLVNAVMIATDMQRSHGEALMGWLWFDLIDFPASVFGLGISLTISDFTWREVWFPILFFGIVGTLQYLLVCEGIARMVKRMK